MNKILHYLIKAIDLILRALIPPVTEEKKIKQKNSIGEYTLKDFMWEYLGTRGYKHTDFPIVGIRDSTGRNQDIINDYLGFLTKDELFLTEGTTEAGVHYVENKKDRNAQGTFYLRNGYHKKIWCLGLHKGYEALVNDWRKCLPTEGWRDANYNYVYDKEDIKVRGHFGINFHRMSASVLVDKIGKYSAGCQVVRNFDDFRYIIDKFKSSGNYIENRESAVVDYMLFDLKELPENLKWRLV